MWTTISAGVLFVILAYISLLVVPSHTFKNVDSAALSVMTTAGGQFLAAFFTAAYVAGAAGSALTSQASVSRILYAMGRDGVLPTRFFGQISTKYGTPVLAILAVSVVSLLAIVIDLTLLAEMISFGALIAFSAVNLSVIKHFFKDLRMRQGSHVVNYLVVPAIGFGLMIWLFTSLSPFTLLVGLIWLAIGVGYLAWVTRGFSRSTPMLDLKE